MERMWASESDLLWWSYQAPPSTGLICPMRLHKPTSGAVREAMASDRPPAQCLAWCFLGQKGKISTFLWIVPPCHGRDWAPAAGSISGSILPELLSLAIYLHGLCQTSTQVHPQPKPIAPKVAT